MKNRTKLSWEYYKKHRILYFGFILVKLLRIVVTIYLPLFFANIITFLADKMFERVYKYIFLLALFSIISILLKYIQKNIENFLKISVNLIIKEKLVKKISLLPCYLYDAYKDSKVFNILTSDSNKVAEYLLLLTDFVINILTVIIIGIVIFNLNILLSLIIILAYPLTILINWLYGKKIKKSSENLIIAYDSYIYAAEKVCNNFDLNIINSHPTKLQNYFLKPYLVFKNKLLAQKKLQVNNTHLIGFISLISYFLILIVGVRLIINGQIELGILIAFISFSNSFTTTLNSIVFFNTNLQPTLTSIDRVINFHSVYMKYYEENNSKLEYKSKITNIMLENISKHFGDKEILRDVNINIPINSVVGVVGENGAGKTTLFKILSHMYLPDKGRIGVNNTWVNSINLESIYSIFSYVGINKTIYKLTVKENLLFSIRDNDFDETTLNNLLKTVNIYSDIFSLKENINTSINNENDLSSGQIQKIQLARMFLKNNPVLIIDEALSELDETSRKLILMYLKLYKKDKIIFITSHNQKDLSTCDIVLNIKNGKIIQV
ncbi:MAG: ABC transporter ATP-binding protein [Tenericutes bacterium]|nr:ABC transporter ATP-binding protein [Mycoplasmatota bacterium]